MDYTSIPSFPTIAVTEVAQGEEHKSTSSSFTCPNEEVPESDRRYYYQSDTNGNHTTKQIWEMSKEELMNSHAFDGWTVTFNTLKQNLYEWKSEFFTDLKSGDAIYESACGEGYNLALTLQILEETKGIKDLTVSGNDFIETSVQIAPEVLRKLAPEGTKIGSLCQADSSNLDFVPSNSFDLAFTGYLHPLTDPLNLYDVAYNEEYCEDFCDYDSNGDDSVEEDTGNISFDKAMQKLIELDQQLQEDWFAKWISELIRIVKPGKPILFEEVSPPLCSENSDCWGGVSKDWWRASIAKYGWDVDEESVVVKTYPYGETRRYYVAMRKKKNN